MQIDIISDEAGPKKFTSGYCRTEACGKGGICVMSGGTFQLTPQDDPTTWASLTDFDTSAKLEDFVEKMKNLHTNSVSGDAFSKTQLDKFVEYMLLENF